jgi:SET domain-containing protein
MATQKITPDMIKVKRSSAGLGVYAVVRIPKGAQLEYTGERISEAESNKRGGKYLFHIDASTVIDGKGRENIARYVNHSCKPNCESVIRGKRVFITTLRAISPAEELTYDYGEEYFDEHIKPFGCRCVVHHPPLSKGR